MRDFDQMRQTRVEQDRGFKIGGEVFIRRPSVRPEAIAPWEGVADNPDISASGVLEAMDLTILNLIEPGKNAEAHKRWKKIRERDDDALNLGDLIDVITWLVEEQTLRPTQRPSLSFDEAGPDGTPSTEGSSPPALREVQTA